MPVFSKFKRAGHRAAAQLAAGDTARGRYVTPADSCAALRGSSGRIALLWLEILSSYPPRIRA